MTEMPATAFNPWTVLDCTLGGAVLLILDFVVTGSPSALATVFSVFTEGVGGGGESGFLSAGGGVGGGGGACTLGFSAGIAGGGVGVCSWGIEGGGASFAGSGGFSSLGFSDNFMAGGFAEGSIDGGEGTAGFSGSGVVAGFSGSGVVVLGFRLMLGLAGGVSGVAGLSTEGFSASSFFSSVLGGWAGCPSVGESFLRLSRGLGGCSDEPEEPLCPPDWSGEGSEVFGVFDSDIVNKYYSLGVDFQYFNF